MMGIDGGRYRSAVHCTTELVRAGGFRVLMNGVGPRVCRVSVSYTHLTLPTNREV